MIIVRLWGGLGNQLFQYSFGQYLEIETDKKVFYDVASFGTSDQLRKLDLCSFIPDIPLYNAYFTRYTGVKNRLFKALFQWSNTYLSESMFDICLLEKARGKIFLQGYWQEEKYATHFPMQKVLSEWKNPNVLSEIEENIRSAKISVSLHVRRGDYFSPKNINVYGVCTEKYYEQAIDRANSEIEEDKQFFVFSDDILWVKNHVSLPESTVFVPNHEISQFAYIYLMSLCKVNIISNSTFSWWGAYLNQHKNQLVIAPSRWTFTSNKTLALDSWTKI